MEQFLRLNATLSKYEPLRVENLNIKILSEMYPVEALNTPAKIDTYISEKMRELYNDMVHQGVPESVLQPLYLEYDMMESAPIINKEVDLDIIKAYGSVDACEAAVEFSKMSIDFYYLERFIRTRFHGDFPSEGKIPLDSFQTFFNLDSLVRNSVYYKELKGIDAWNFEMKFDQALIQAMRSYQNEMIGVNGIFSKVFMRLLDLRNHRIVLKGHLYDVDVSKMVRDLYG